MPKSSTCPVCSADHVSVHYEVRDVPVNSVIVIDTRADAVAYPRGTISLGFCHECGFVFNAAFEPDLVEYSQRYESTQTYSQTFGEFSYQTAQSLVDRYELRGKRIIEIGCGNGEFLNLLCQLGGNEGIGFDPACNVDSGDVTDSVRFVKDFYSETYSDLAADFICCKMTLEHVPNPRDLVETVRRSVDDNRDTVVFFQVPNFLRILRDAAFWDVYYEHCSYFCPGSLASLFRRCGFEVMDLYTAYDDQYLMIEAQPANNEETRQPDQEENTEELYMGMMAFGKSCRQKREFWDDLLEERRQNGERAVLWGGGSKAVAFLTAIEKCRDIEYVVDINPKKRNTFLPAVGQHVVEPAYLVEYRPEYVVVMNPVYCDEIGRSLSDMGLTPVVLPVT